jgi:hypothetical protein
LEYHENLAIRGFKPDRISKKPLLLPIIIFEKEQKFAVTSIWRRQTDWYCVSRQLTLIA